MPLGSLVRVHVSRLLDSLRPMNRDLLVLQSMEIRALFQFYVCRSILLSEIRGISPRVYGHHEGVVSLHLYPCRPQSRGLTLRHRVRSRARGVTVPYHLLRMDRGGSEKQHRSFHIAHGLMRSRVLLRSQEGTRHSLKEYSQSSHRKSLVFESSIFIPVKSL